MRRLQICFAVCLALCLLNWAGVSRAQAAQPADVNTKPARYKKAFVRMHVVGVDKKPIAGAEIYWFRTWEDDRQPMQPRLVGTTDQSGDARFENPSKGKLDKQDPGGWAFWDTIVVKANGHGFTRTSLEELRQSTSGFGALFPEMGGAQEASVELPAAGDSIRGRLVDTAGRPVAGVTLRIRSFNGQNDPLWIADSATEEKFDKGVTWWRQRAESLLATEEELFGQVLPTATTNADGRFELRGLGRERLVHLLVQGDHIETTDLIAWNGSDDEVVLPDPEDLGFTIYGRNVQCTIGSSKPVAGRVVDFDTGNPIADAVVRAFKIHRHPLHGGAETVHYATRSDKDGRYRITGLPLGDGNRLAAFTTGDVAYIPVGHQVDTSVQEPTIRLDFRLKRGIWAEGRVFDAKTDRPFVGQIAYHCFRNQELENDIPGVTQADGGYCIDSRYWTNANGEFRVPVLPSRGILAFVYRGTSRRGLDIDRMKHFPRGYGADAIEGAENFGAGLGFPTFPRYCMVADYNCVAEVLPVSGKTSVRVDMPLLAEEAVSGAQAAQPADAVPDSASLVLRWKSPRASLERLAEFADATLPGLGFGERINREWLSLAVGTISGGELPDMAGVDASQDFWIILIAESGREMPLVTFMVTAKDVEAVKTALDDQFATHAVGNLVVFSEDEEAVDKVRDQLQRKQSTFWSGVDAASKRLFDASDVSVIVNVRRLTDEFRDIVTWAETLINTFQVSNSPSKSDKGQLDQLEDGQLAALQSYMSAYEDLYRDIGRDVIRGIRDSKCLVLGVSFSKTAIRCETALQVEMETPTASAFARQTTSALSLVSRLPANKAVYYGVCGDMAGYMDWSREFTRKMLKPSSNEESGKLNAALLDTGSVKLEEMAGYLDVAANDPAIRMGTVSMMTPTKPMRELNHLFYKAMSKLPTPFSSMKLESGVDKIGAVEVDRITENQKFDEAIDEAMDPTGLIANCLKILCSKKGLETLEMYQTNRLLQVTGGGKPDLQSLIAAFDAPPAKGSPVAAARLRLAEKANVVVLIDLARLILFGAPWAAHEGLLPIDAGSLDGLKTDPSFIGFSLTCDPTAIRLQLDIPLGQAQNIAKVMLPLVTAAKK